MQFNQSQKWLASAQASYIYQIDYPVYHPEDPFLIEYGALKHKTGSAEMVDLGRYATYEAAVKACEDDAAAVGVSPFSRT
jgi:hypothetical protein